MARSLEEIRKAKREAMARRRAADPEAARKYHRERHFKNHEVNKGKMRAYAQRRFFWNREMHLRGPNRATAKQLARLWKVQRGCCALTGRRLTKTTAHLDHIIPIAKGGGHHAANLRWLCHEANLAKRALSDAEFTALCSDVMAWLGQRIALVETLLLEKVAA